MANHAIINFADSKPHNSFNAANVNFVNETINDNNATTLLHEIFATR